MLCCVAGLPGLYPGTLDGPGCAYRQGILMHSGLVLGCIPPDSLPSVPCCTLLHQPMLLSAATPTSGTLLLQRSSVICFLLIFSVCRLLPCGCRSALQVSTAGQHCRSALQDGGLLPEHVAEVRTKYSTGNHTMGRQGSARQWQH
jgi:hypothetical protein